MSALRFVVPMPETLTNSGKGRSRHWWATYRDKKAYWARLDLLKHYSRKHKLNPAGGLFVPQPPEKPFDRVTIRSVMHLGGAMDDDNAMARHKVLLDWIKGHGYIVDDRRKNVKWESFPEQIVKRDGNYRIELTLTPVESSGN